MSPQSAISLTFPTSHTIHRHQSSKNSIVWPAPKDGGNLGARMREPHACLTSTRSTSASSRKVQATRSYRRCKNFAWSSASTHLRRQSPRALRYVFSLSSSQPIFNHSSIDYLSPSITKNSRVDKQINQALNKTHVNMIDLIDAFAAVVAPPTPLLMLLCKI